MDLEAAADLFRTLADPTRRAIFERLARGGELSVGALTEGAQVSQPAVSQHLKALRNAGVVLEQRAGRQVLYRARPEGLAPMFDWLAHYAAFWPERFDRLEQLLKEMDQ
ncbi:transcriptional regulator [Phenylobacterium hankyongense]|uniref:Transcriptional regulator n=2 Tax=Phenylobacterium hankyongense TaxID=1813876 RepID=A0A328AZ26_9CAUL|nr:transcriptional regulator [Phenylobacterium hankyongense]